jgi:3-hydroxy acid dehydrogenase/malonic semialdehyde reductase
MKRHILITGASAGIGAATARRLATGDNKLSLGARRVERLPEVVKEAFVAPLDVTDESSVNQFLIGAVATNGPVDVLVNNAGLARGLEPVADAEGRAWREMIETNICGVLNITRRVLPQMIERGTGHIVMVGSIASRETYEGGSVYCATKRALQAITEGIRLETLGTGIRISSIDPGLVDTEFSLVRFSGDEDKARKPYEGMQPLTAEDVAECVEFALSRPPHVNIDTLLVMPTDQAGVRKVHRRAT